MAELWSFLALEASEAVATRFVTDIADRFAEMREFPLLGTAREQLASGLRVVFHRSHAIYTRSPSHPEKSLACGFVKDSNQLHDSRRLPHSPATA